MAPRSPQLLRAPRWRRQVARRQEALRDRLLPRIESSAARAENKLSQGTVKWFSDEKGYGFITPEDGSKDLFVHHSNILGEGFKSLSEGQKVSYEAAEGRKGPEATSVSPA